MPGQPFGGPGAFGTGMPQQYGAFATNAQMPGMGMGGPGMGGPGMGGPGMGGQNMGVGMGGG